MNTREATRQFRIQQWTQIIHDRAESGMTIKDYCKKNNLGRDAYFYWAKIIKEEALKNLPQQQFVELPLSQTSDLPQVARSTPVFTAELKLQIKDVSITVTDATSPALLARTLEVVNNVL